MAMRSFNRLFKLSVSTNRINKFLYIRDNNDLSVNCFV